jgi:cyclophilin family peptidyl-prolyl cis-trans isomerase
MKRMLSAAVAVVVAGALTSVLAVAHEGHDHGTATPAKPASTGAAATQASPKSAVAKAASNAKDKSLMTIDAQVAKVDKTKSNWKTTLTKPELMTFEEGKTYYARMATTKGPVLIKFLPKTAPVHVSSFIYLARLGFYDGLAFHRVIPGFMAQGGCPLGNGTGGPGYQFAGEYDPSVKHGKGGLLSMANAGPGTDGSQFFLTFVATPWLDGKHTIFGEVVEGMETLKALEAVGSQGGRTSEPVKMDKVTIEVK